MGAGACRVGGIPTAPHPTHLCPVVLEDHEAGLGVSGDRGLQAGAAGGSLPTRPRGQLAQPAHPLHQHGVTDSTGPPQPAWMQPGTTVGAQGSRRDARVLSPCCCQRLGCRERGCQRPPAQPHTPGSREGGRWETWRKARREASQKERKASKWKGRQESQSTGNWAGRACWSSDGRRTLDPSPAHTQYWTLNREPAQHGCGESQQPAGTPGHLGQLSTALLSNTHGQCSTTVLPGYPQGPMPQHHHRHQHGTERSQSRQHPCAGDKVTPQGPPPACGMSNGFESRCHSPDMGLGEVKVPLKTPQTTEAGMESG